MTECHEKKQDLLCSGLVSLEAGIRMPHLNLGFSCLEASRSVLYLCLVSDVVWRYLAKFECAWEIMLAILLQFQEGGHQDTFA